MSCRVGARVRAALVVGVAVAATAGFATLGTGAARATQPLPAGKANWVVSVGGLNTAAANSYRNWVRLGDYTLDPARTVPTSPWNRAQPHAPGPVGTVPAAGQFSNYSATFGVGWGSNASLGSTSRVSMSQLLSDPAYNSMPLKGRYDVANAGTVSQQHAGFGPLGYGDTSSSSLDYN